VDALGSGNSVSVNDAGSQQATDLVNGRDLAESTVQERGCAVGGIDHGSRPDEIGDLSVKELRDGPTSSSLE